MKESCTLGIYGSVMLHVPNGVKGRAGHPVLSLTAISINCLEVPAVVASVKPGRRK